MTMLSTILLFALGGYLGTPSVHMSKWASKIQFDDGWGPNPGPDDGPRRVIKIKWPPLPPWWWWTIGGAIGGVIGGFAVNAGFAENPVLALGGAMIGGRLTYDVVNAFQG
jgi:drug/metabolite transporter (DMT)-like permease